ncbi:response regulator transcription factor [Virgibacillus halodenitrificans]|uniref:Response regulator transcription factor n=1 Tax=Virgibacillus halodenitrificans TaxID=1482 RepID=A0ABR7VRR6_VIRHA|nr:response regulator transcription factor [Virgibacillus halodenitrificans]MBD1224577.1 response regulator transcription factor [Virgibacillus halodenitrificans]MYL56920.1 response regulator [Virgibacillus halodenitrificans]
MKQKICVVDDEAKILRFISANLKSVGYDVVTVGSGEEFLEKYDLISPDLILLDIMMPGMDGFNVLESLRKFTNVPTIMLTARSNPKDKVSGLNLGADDYLTKPFSLDELFARVNAVLRRSQPSAVDSGQAATSVIETGQLEIDIGSKRCWIYKDELKLTQTEFSLLEILALNIDKVVQHETLLSEVWGPQYRDDVEYLRVTIARIRRKIKARLQEPEEYIITYPGLGYMLRSISQSTN